MDIESRLRSFKRTDPVLEFIFCLLTPQSKAKVCWNAVMELKKHNLIYKGSASQVVKYLSGVRFKRRKAKYIVEDRKHFDYVKNIRRKDPFVAREWLVKHVKGMGYKEASHFLRNVGFKGLAILDRHILNTLVELGVISEIPSLTRKNYLLIEQKFKDYAKKNNTTIDYLDLLFWSKKTGYVFK